MICCYLPLSFEKTLVLSVFPCIAFGGTGLQRCQLSKAAAAKAFRLRPLGEQGELTQGREAAFNHLAEAPSSEILHCANSRQPPRFITPLYIPVWVIPTSPLPEQTAVIYLCNSPMGLQSRTSPNRAKRTRGTESPRKLGVTQEDRSNATAEVVPTPAFLKEGVRTQESLKACKTSCC